MNTNSIGDLNFNNSTIPIYTPLEKGVVCVKEEILTENAYQIVYGNLFSQLFVRILFFFNLFALSYTYYIWKQNTKLISVQRRINVSINIILFMVLQINMLMLSVIIIENLLFIIFQFIIWFIMYLLLLYKFTMFLFPVITLIIRRIKDGKKEK